MSSGSDQLGPWQFQRRSELVERVPHALLAAGEVKREVGAEPCPAKAGTIGGGVVQVACGSHAVVDQMEDLPPHRLLEPVGQVTRYFSTDDEGIHVQKVVHLFGPLDRFVRGEVATDDLAQREQVDRVERVADDDSLRMPTVRCDAGGKQAR